MLDVQRILLVLEEDEDEKKARPTASGTRIKNPKRRGNGGNGNGNSGGNRSGNRNGNRIKNPCKLPGHSSHEYKD